MKNFLLISVMCVFGLQAQAAVVGSKITGKAAKTLFINLTKACGGDCGVSGMGKQVAQTSYGQVYVSCEINTEDALNGIAKASDSKFSCTVNN